MMVLWIAVTLILAGAVPWPAESFTIEEARLYLTDNGTVLETDGFGNALGDSIPPELGSLTNLTYLELYHNNLTGPIPPELGNLIKLTFLEFFYDNLTGPIPPELGNLTKLQTLNLGYNHLTGPIPSELGNLTSLTYLELSGNTLSGSVPLELYKLRNLEYLGLGSNNLSAGLISSELGSLTNLTYLSLSGNDLVGLIPRELGNLTNLQYLDLSSNNLTGPIPPELGNLTKLQYLFLSFNNLTGPIPRELGKLTKLQYLYLSYNNLTGPIPRELDKLINLQHLDLSNNKLTGPIPRELTKLTNLRYLNLRDNNLVGSIPPQLSNLTNLLYLYLGNNGLSGSIPSELGSLTNLDTLNLSNNKLNGSIPFQLANLPSLSFLSLSNNNLSGAIPSKLSKLNLSGVFFDGNPFLGPIPQALASNELFFIGVAGALPQWLKSTAKRLVYILIGPGSTSMSTLDLTSAPTTCQFIEWVGGPISDIIFWDACKQEGGCAVSLIGSSTSSLSQKTRRHVCLNRISVFLKGAKPSLDRESLQYVLRNEFGVYFLSGPDAGLHGIDTISLGPSGLSYTGVGVTRVREDNLCGNPGALKIVLGTFGTFSGLLLLVGLGIWVVHHFPTLHEDDADGSSPGFIRAVRDRFGAYLQRFEDWSVAKMGRLWGAYGWGLIGVGLMALDMYSDTVVLVDVWHAWPMWPILGSLCAPYIVAGLFQAANLVRCRPAQGDWLRFVWIWPPHIVDKVEMPGIVDKRGTWTFAPGRQEDTSKLSRREWLLTILAWPIGIVYVFILDVAAILGKVGFHPEIGGEVYNMEHYHEGRTSLELLLESLPQAVFQSIVFVLGSSMATRIFIDEETFFLSIMSSLANILFRYCTFMWDLQKDKRGFLELLEFRYKFRSGPCRIVRQQQISCTDGPEVAQSDKTTAT